MIFDDAKEKTNTLWLLQKIKTLCTRSKFQGCLYQHAEYLPCQSEQPRQLTGKPSEITWRTILFCFSPEGWIHCWVWVISGHDSSPCSNSPIKFEHEFASQRFFCFATGCWRGYGRNFGRELWKEIYTQRSRAYIRADRSFPKSQIGTTENNLNCHGNVKLVAVAPIWNHPRFLGTSSKPNHYFQSSVKIHFINGRKFIECQQHSCFR